MPFTRNQIDNLQKLVSKSVQEMFRSEDFIQLISDNIAKSYCLYSTSHMSKMQK